MREPEVFKKTVLAGKKMVSEPDAKSVFRAHGITVPNGGMVLTADAGAQLSSGIGYPVVVKAVSRDLVHKSEYGAVHIGLNDPETVRSSIRTMQECLAQKGKTVDGFLVEQMVDKGHELVVGCMVDSRFGPVIMVGLGGIFVEIMEDISFRICPITEIDAVEMLNELKAISILRGARGGVVASEKAIVDILLKLGGEDGLMLRWANEVSEVDINPLIVTEYAAVAADVRIILQERT